MITALAIVAALFLIYLLYELAVRGPTDDVMIALLLALLALLLAISF